MCWLLGWNSIFARCRLGVQWSCRHRLQNFSLCSLLWEEQAQLDYCWRNFVDRQLGVVQKMWKNRSLLWTMVLFQIGLVSALTQRIHNAYLLCSENFPNFQWCLYHAQKMSGRNIANVLYKHHEIFRELLVLFGAIPRHKIQTKKIKMRIIFIIDIMIWPLTFAFQIWKTNYGLALPALWTLKHCEFFRSHYGPKRPTGFAWHGPKPLVLQPFWVDYELDCQQRQDMVAAGKDFELCEFSKHAGAKQKIASLCYLSSQMG